MRKPWFWLAASLLIAVPAGAATVLQRTIDVAIDSNGRVVETHSLRVRLETTGDRDDWSPYPILLDDNRKIQIQSAGVERPDGTSKQVEKKDLDTLGVTGEGVLHGSQRFRTVAFPDSPPGSILSLSYRVELRPYFPADTISIFTLSPTDNLRVRISGGGASFRYRLDGEAPGLVVTPVQGGVEVVGQRLPGRLKLEFASRMDIEGPTLRYGWGGPSKWEDVGEWYLGLIADLPRASAAVRQDALSLKAADDRATIERIVEQVRTKVRYVAVEVGIGGYRPHAPEDVRAKSWGDCKDKATLMIEMLAAVGIEAFPTLILSSDDGRVDAAFPAADHFNHMIVAIPQAHLGAVDGLPVADGYFFIDPTQEKGGLSWFGSSTQDQDALVVRRGASRLVKTPKMKGGDVRTTEVHLAPRAQGGLEGKATLGFKGDLASYYVRQSATQRPEEFRGNAETAIRARLPGADVRLVDWTKGSGDTPDLTFAATVVLNVPATTRSLVLPSRPLTPSLATLEKRVADIVLDVPVATTTWKVDLPQGWCAPRLSPQSIENEIGLFRQTVEASGSLVTIARHIEIRQHWVRKEQFPKLRELILAEHRANARSLRFECDPSTISGTAKPGN